MVIDLGLLQDERAQCIYWLPQWCNARCDSSQLEGVEDKGQAEGHVHNSPHQGLPMIDQIQCTVMNRTQASSMTIPILQKH